MITIIADDFTGAAEVAGICLRRGVSVSFLTDIPEVETIQDVDTDVLVVAEDTRSFTAEGAVKISRILAENLKAAGVTHVVKKIDSALRGWVLLEMRAIADVFGMKELLIQPANTATHRSIKNGLYYVEDKLLAETAFANDPEFPVKSSQVHSIIESRNVVVSSSPINYMVPDAVTSEDLRASVRLCHEGVLPGGSADFWREYLEEQIELGKVKAFPKDEDTSELSPLQDCLMICGSAHLNSMQGSERLAAEGMPLMNLPASMLQEDKVTDADIQAFVEACATTWEISQRLLVRFGPKPVKFDSCAEHLRYRMTESMFLLLQKINPSHLLIEGGATAYSLLQRLGWNSFTPVREWTPGVVQLKLNTEPYCYITLKPGSYAWPEFE